MANEVVFKLTCQTDPKTLAYLDNKEREREATLRPGDLAKGKMRKVAREEGPK